MKLFRWFNRVTVPEEVLQSTLVVAPGAVLQSAGPFLQALANKFGRITITSDAPASGIPFYFVPWPERHVLNAFFEKAAPARVIVLSNWPQAETLPALTKAPCYWVNATNAVATDGFAGVTVANQNAAQALPHAALTGDPLLDDTKVAPAPPDSCERFKEQRDAGRWVGYFAGTGENEEEMAYLTFNRLIRHKMGLMVLAPRDPRRCEPVYRESIKYRLQTIRHNRLSTSFIPIKTRVYYVEAAEPLHALYNCVDFVVAGGTLSDASRATPDVVSPMRAGRPVIVGQAGREHPWVRAAIDAGVVAHAESADGLFDRARELIESPQLAAQQTTLAGDWLALQTGARARVLEVLR